MGGSTPSVELLNRAFRLAYFILGERTSALYLTMAAADKLKAASAIQERRLYYVPTGRPAYRAARTKVNLSHLHLLQRLVYIESEAFERLIEGRESPVPRADMVIRFVKHLVTVSTKRNSFYVALGICRLLHNYTTAETAEIYNLVLQDPDRGRDDYYYRSRKKHLLREIKERFGGSLQTFRGHRGEERFRPEEDSGRYADLVRECLLRFTPWESACVLPEGLDPMKDIVEPLQFRGQDPDGEHAVELNRIHTLLDPDCFERVVSTLGLDHPSERLELPRFTSAGDRDVPKGRLESPALSRGELDAVRRQLDKGESRRKEASGDLFSVLVDGGGRKWLESGAGGRVRFHVGEGSELIEVRGVEGLEELPIVVYPLVRRGGLIMPSKSSVRLSLGRRLSVEVRPPAGTPAEGGGAVVSVEYSAGVIGRVSSAARRLSAETAEAIARAPSSVRTNRRKVVLACLLAAVGVTCLIIYLRARDPHEGGFVARREQGEQGSMEGGPPAQTPPGGQSSPHHSGGTTPSQEPSPRRRPPPPQPAAGRGSTPAPDGGTRGPDPRVISAQFLAVKRIYVDPLGEGPVGTQVREMLIGSLRATGRFVIVEARDEADAVIKGAVRRTARGVGGVSVALRLVNAEGEVLWSTTAPARRGATPVTAAEAASEATKVLMSDLRGAEGKP